MRSIAMSDNNTDVNILRPQLPDDSTIKVIGLGGVGGIVARYCSIFLASLQQPVRLVCIDGDSFEPDNASRMMFSALGNKAVVIINELSDKFIETQLSLLAIEEYVTEENIHNLIQNDDIILLAVDNHATRKLVSDFCSHQRSIVLISGGNDGVEISSTGRQLQGTYGNCQVYIRNEGKDISPSLKHYHQEIANPEDVLPDAKSCSELLLSVPQILFTNLATASAILNTFWLYICNSLPYSELAFDISKGLMRPVFPLSFFAGKDSLI